MVLVRYFAAAAAAAGVSEEHVRTPAATTREELQRLLVDLHPVPPRGEPPLARVLPRCSWLVDAVAARDPHTPVSSDATVDVLPPFAGG